MGAERSQWQFPANEVGKVIGWSDEASPSNPNASKGLVNKGPFIDPDATDASGFGFVIDEDDMASDLDTKLPTQQSVNAAKLQKVATRAAMKALSGVTHPAIYLYESGREGVFTWSGADLSTEVAADTAEGIYVAPASDSDGSSGAWVRVWNGSSADFRWFGGVVGDASGANASENDTAIAAAIAVPEVMTIKLPAGIIEVSARIDLNRDGVSLKGHAAFQTFGLGSAGTILRWYGAGSAIIKIENSTLADTYSNHVTNLEIDGNDLATIGINVLAAQFPQVLNVAIKNLDDTASPIGIVTGSKTGSSSGTNCTYRGSFKNIAIQVGGGGSGLYNSGKDSVEGANTTFCTFENIHVTHDDGVAFQINAADDCTYLNCAASRVSGGTGAALLLDGNSANGKWVVGNTFYQFHAGTTDGSSAITANGVRSRQNKIYGLSGVDDAAVINILNGAQLFYDYLGSGYTSSLADELPVNRTAPLQVASGLRTSSLAGMVEYDGSTFYGSTVAAQRGVLPPRMFASPLSSVALSNSSTSAQNIFPAANDTLSLQAGTTYRFRAQILLNTGAVSHTTSFGFGGTATFTSATFRTMTTSSAAGTLAAIQARRFSTATGGVVNAASTEVTTDIWAEGTLRVNAAGTVIPQVTFSAGPTGTCEVAFSSFIEFEPIGTSSVAAVGSWA